VQEEGRKHFKALAVERTLTTEKRFKSIFKNTPFFCLNVWFWASLARRRREEQQRQRQRRQRQRRRRRQQQRRRQRQLSEASADPAYNCKEMPEL
jgi:choline-glycine betaine transporter